MLIAKYTCNASGVVPIFNDEYEYEINETENNGIYTVEITSDNNFSSCSFNSKTQLLTVEFLKVTSKVTNMSIMFNNCNNLTSLDLSNFDTKNVTNMSNMFYGCTNLTSLDVSNFDTQNVIIMSNMFYGCTNLTSLDLSNFDTSNVTTMNAMFNTCKSLTSLDISSFNTSKVTNMQSMFSGCTNLTSLDLSNFDTSNVTAMNGMSAMFNSCHNLTSLDISSFNTSEVTSMQSMFNGCTNLTSLDLSNFITSKVTTMYGMFQSCNSLTSLDISSFNTSEVTSMDYMFAHCSNLTSLDLSNFNTSKVTTMAYMFSNCSNLTSLDVSNFDTKNVTSMYAMFQSCKNLTSLDLSSFDTKNVTTMLHMFNGCKNLTSLDVSNFETSNVTTMYVMFSNCSNLTSLGLIYANIDTINQLPTPSTATLYIDTNIDQTAYTGSSKLETYEQRTVTINIPTALRSNGEIADRLYWNDEDKHYYIEQNINPNTNETLETPNIIASGVKQPIYLKIYEDMLSVGISNIDASYMSINVPFFEIPTDYEYKWEDELDYIKQSFELRFPDEDDVPEGWGFMYANSTKTCIDVYSAYDNSDISTPLLSTEYFGTNTLSIRTEPVNVNVTVYTDGSQTFWSPIPNTITIDEGCSFRIGFPLNTQSTDIKYIVINDVYYDINLITKDVDISKIYADPYEAETVDDSLGLKVLIDWVDGCTDEEFVRDFDQHFNRDYTLRYFLLVITLGMVDNLGKNMMLDTWDNKIFMPRFYDCDTICSYDNSGQLKFGVDIEMTQGYWNTSSSRLWTRIRDLMHDELVAKYNNMRQNGLSYESLMECFYDEQIAKIPQKYYNMDYDVKYAPFADSYIGMANGDTYEHLKRWLQQRLRFVDSLYDYAPSYNNDVLTIRANTTEPMTLEIETYTPVYQHLSWYNNQMDKKKIDGKISVTFTGTAMAATDQEVLIYGGSNIKSIKGITSMNPNRMLIGSATRLIELDAPNCPLLADINANKANLAPHVYLNKVNLSGCPLLGGNLIINQSPLIREIDIRNTAITGLNLPSNLRNLEVLKLPAAIETLTLNDAGQLHTLEFDAGGRIQNVTMTNCNALTNITNFNLEDATSISLNNSYNTANELYFSKATNLSVSNMPNLERLIYTPNAEHEVFDKVNVDNASNYTVSTFNCPKLNTFMTTAPYRESYNNCEIIDIQAKDYGEVKPNEVFEANTIDISNTQFTDVKLLCTTDTNVLKLPQTVKNLIVDSAYDLDTKYLTDGDYDVIHTKLYEPYNTDYEGEVNLPDYILEYMKQNGKVASNMQDNCRVDSTLTLIDDDNCATTQILPMPTNKKVTIKSSGTGIMFRMGFYDVNKVMFEQTSATTITTPYEISFDDNVSYFVITYYKGASSKTNNIWLEFETTHTPNLIPSASDGSIIQSMYAPSNTIQPASGVWDLKGFVFDNYHIFGLNNDVKLVDNTLTMPNRYDEYSLSIKNKTVKNEIARYTASDRNTFPTFNSEFIYTYNVALLDEEVYEYSIIADSMDNLPTSISFKGKSSLLTVEYLNVDNVTNMVNMFSGCTNLTSLDVSSFNTSKVTSMCYMFNGCTNLTSLDLSNFDTSNVTDMSGMFNGCNNLTSLDISSFNTSNVTTMYVMFQSCNSLTTLDISNFDTSKVTTVNGMSAMFNGCTNLTSLDLSNFDTKNVTSMYAMFNGCTNLTSLDLSNFDTSEVTSMQSMFNGCKNLTSLDVSNFETSNVDNMTYMFAHCINLTSLDLSNFNTSKVTSMDYMFYGCSKLTSLDLSGFDTSKVTNMSNMFASCRNLTRLDSMMNISKSLHLSSTFLDASSLLDVIDNLAAVTTTQTLTLGATLLAKLTEEQIAVAVYKGWTVV